MDFVEKYIDFYTTCQIRLIYHVSENAILGKCLKLRYKRSNRVGLASENFPEFSSETSPMISLENLLEYSYEVLP